MRHYTVSPQVAVVIMLMALILTSGTALGGEEFRLLPRADELTEWPMPIGGGAHWSRVNDTDGFRDGADIEAIGQNRNKPNPVTDIFDLNSITRPRPVTVWTLRGVIHARGRSTPTGRGRVQFWIRKGGSYIDMGSKYVWPTASQFDGFTLGLTYTDWTQQEIDEAKIKVMGWRPVYPYGASPSGSTHVEEVRAWLFCSDP